jgi:hypothetical protein
MQDRLNFFEPWQRLPAYHEDQLTRALLVVLRYCPMAQQAWLSLVECDRALHSLPRPTFDTQRARILRSKDQPTTDEPIRGISVLCSADVASDTLGIMLESDRGQVLDGIIRYGNEIVIVLESKLDGPADDRQARNINLHGQPIVFDGPIRRISWRDILANFADLADEDRALTSGAERALLTDFLIFVDTNFPQLGPFSTLQRCNAEPSRVRQRLNAILRDILATEDNSLPGAHTAVVTAYLEYKDRQVQLHMYPADTLQQARVFYGRPHAVERTLMLQDNGWTIEPNFHFGFMAKGLSWTETDLLPEDYLRYWQRNIGSATQVERRDWNAYWEELLKAKIAKPSDRDQFDHDFTNTDRQFASPRPGLNCAFSWDLDEAERLDARGQFAQAVKQSIDGLLEALGENKIDL